MTEVVVSQEEIANFRMPRVRHGEIVAWYPSGSRTRSPEVAQVYRVSGRNVHLLTATRGVREAVRHIDDPKLRLNPEQREMGAWDFTEASKERDQQIADLEEEVRAIRRQLTTLIAAHQQRQVKRKAGQGLQKYQELRNKAIELGVKVEGNPSTDWLREQIKALENGSDGE